MNLYTAILLEFLLISLSILLMFRYRTKLGLAPLYILLGSVQYIQALSGTMVSIKVFDEYTIYPSSVILFSAVLFAILLIYIKEGVASARTLIIGIIISNVILSALFGITYVQENAVQIINVDESLPILQINYKYFIIGTIILFIDFILLVIIYQFLISKLNRLYFFLILFVSLCSVLLFDSFAFNFVLKYGTPIFTTSLIGHILGKSVSAVIFSLILYIYLKYIDKEEDNVSFIATQDRDIFSILLYRKKYFNLKEEKKEVEKKYISQIESTLNQISDGFVSLDRDWCYTYVNDKAGEFLGRSPESLIGNYIWTEFPEGVGLPVYHAYHKALETQKTQYLIEYYEPFDKWFESRIYPSINGLSIYFTDFTERKKAEIALKESEKYLDNIIDNIGDPVFVKDSESHLLLVNDAFCKIFNVAKKDVIGKTLAENVPPEERESFLRIDKQVILTGVENVNEETLTLIGKETQIVSTKKSRFVDSNGTKFLIGVIRDITERKKAEVALKNSEERLRLSTELANVAVWEFDFSINNMKRSANHDALYGIVNQDNWKMETFLDATHPDDRKMSETYIIKSKEKGGPDTYQFDFRVIYPNKSIHWLSVLGHVIKRNADGVALTIRGTLMDITDRKKTEEEIRMADQRLKTHLNNSPLAIIEWDNNFIIRNWSVQAKSIFGWEESEAIGKHFNELNLVHEEDGAAILIVAEDLMLGKVKSNRNINRNYTKSKKVIYCEWYNSVLQSADGEIETIFSLVQDITERKKTEIELEKHRNNLKELVELRTNQLEKEKVKAQSADLMKSAFLATMSHELRTPMNSIIGFTGILLNELAGPLNDEQKRQLGMVKNSGQHLLGLINDVLDISKIEAGRLKVSLYHFNYLTTLEKTIDFLLPQASKKELQILLEISELNITLNSDERRVEQVLLNLLSNAIKFSNQGAITVKVDIVDGLVVTQVIDQGIGMIKKDLNKLFEPFIQLEHGLNRSHEGTGLGLAICKSLIEKLGGTINVQSKKGVGSNFTFTLPLDSAIKN